KFRAQPAISGDDKACIGEVLPDERKGAQEVLGALALLKTAQIQNVQLVVLILGKRRNAWMKAVYIHPVGDDAIVAREEARDKLTCWIGDSDTPVEAVNVAAEKGTGRDIGPLAGGPQRTLCIGVERANVDGICRALQMQDSKGNRRGKRFV